MALMPPSCLRVDQVSANVSGHLVWRDNALEELHRRAHEEPTARSNRVLCEQALPGVYGHRLLQSHGIGDLAKALFHNRMFVVVGMTKQSCNHRSCFVVSLMKCVPSRRVRDDQREAKNGKKQHKLER